MSKKDKKATLFKELIVNISLLIIFYLGVMLVKYLTNDELTWLSTFIMMFSIVTIYFILRRTIQGRKDR